MLNINVNEIEIVLLVCSEQPMMYIEGHKS